MSEPEFVLLVVAKAPVPGLAKTRLCPPATPDQAAAIAAAALLDTLDAAAATPGAIPLVALTGSVPAGVRAHEVRSALEPLTVHPQRGDGLAERLVNAHQDAADRFPGLPVLQIGMDTPQVTPALLAATARPVLTGAAPAVLGPAADGGWWALALRDPRQARALADVPMSRADTAARTRLALGEPMGTAAVLVDVDTMPDALAVAADCPDTRFAEAVRAVVVPT
ncbi:DUF2064 domain-containing protein [Actinokineospora auranticolor]|uniref:Glycosyltransferase A (GT-A) superfamily protein (DUF2064 family) n=1 Tax=Actinokineospora auranticolor TaxID=155976 RepID=A0A2S6GLV8_9PSEU|nr:DUF2064 domain-containing protein [Actinokineospora auranticolor]PPK66131.1 hypothetical protein CLV40_11195 [Actinokineospora auranticolor]